MCFAGTLIQRKLPPMSDITRLLEAIQQGDAQAGEDLLPLVYAELRQLARTKMAREKPGHTLQPTALANEAYLRLRGLGDVPWHDRAHFCGAPTVALRRFLVEGARRHHREKRGGGAEHLNVDDLEIAAPTKNDAELLAVHEALDQLAALDPRKAELVKLRYFGGLSFEETAGVLGISVPTAHRDWAYARAWLFNEVRRLRS
jgi:RNA polymerase sigma factor (TIGR02999 family)